MIRPGISIPDRALRTLPLDGSCQGVISELSHGNGTESARRCVKVGTINSLHVNGMLIFYFVRA